jgi:hypothetical protein
MKPNMKFSWTALILAPLPVPFVYTVAFVCSNSSRSPILQFLFFFVLGSVFSYCTTIFLFLPCLFLVSRLTPLTARLTCILGTVLGALVFIPVAWQMFLTSGIDSGPPQGYFVEYLWRQLSDPAVWAFPVAGLVTAMLYWLLCGVTLAK